MKQRVLFVCIGNSCRSQMAEGFARSYGHDVIEPASAGLSPAHIVDPNTRAVMAERGISLDAHYPKTLEEGLRLAPALLINMSGSQMPHFAAGLPAEVWRVRDPVGESPAVHREVRDEVEYFVMNLILRLRQRKPPPTTQEDPTPPKRFKFGRMA